MSCVLLEVITRHSRALKSFGYKKYPLCVVQTSASVQWMRKNTTYSKKPFKQVFVKSEEQSFLLPGPDRARASKLTGNPFEIISDIPGAPLVQTIYDVLQHGLKVSNDGECIGSKSIATGQYEWQKYSDVIRRSHHIGSAMVHLGLKPSNETFIGIFAKNREEFLLSLYGCSAFSMVMVPLYVSLGIETVMFIIKQANLPLVIVSDNKNAKDILSNSSFPFLKTLVIMDEPTEETKNIAKTSSMRLITFSTFEELGKQNKKDMVLPSPDDLFCIPYTSGTTGIPKGVMVTHRNMVACMSSLVIGYGDGGIYGGTIMSYLPPAHIYEICNQVASLYFARRIAFYADDIKKLFEEVRLVKPTIMPLVPRLMNVIYMNVMESVKGHALKSFLLKLALSRKEALLEKGVITKKTIWDKLVFKNFRDFLGGEVHMIITTSAPVSPDVMRFFRCAAGCYVIEAYGQTEVLASTMSLPHEHVGGSVGSPLPCNHVKLSDVPEMGYFAKNDTGEVCFKGANVFKGYFKNEDATKECIDADGWHHSGDIGRWLPTGALQIIDRRKHLFKLSQGEYIAPEKVENTYSLAKEVAQIYIDGCPNEDYIVALVVPEPANFKKWLQQKKFAAQDLDELLKSKDVRRAFLLELHKFGKKEDLNPLEQAKNLIFLNETFTIENGLLTPTLKLKRNEARKHFETVLQTLYKEGPLVASTKS